MAGSKSDRKVNAKFSIFANNEAANDEVRVGYIDPKRGYVSGLTVYEANRYAERNPGTQFISANRDAVRYLNINEVNALTNTSILPKSRPNGLVDNDTDEFDPCNTVRGFTTDPDNASEDNAGGEPEIKPPITGSEDGGFDTGNNYNKYNAKCKARIELQGGGGIGALATPIIGEDGSILHVRVISGGFGYKVPPQVRIIDDCRRGSGARGFSVLGNTALEEENFDDDADVEEYDFTLGDFNFDPDDSPWGSVYSMSNQTVIGDWNPANVISLTQTTGFQQQLQEYLAFLKGYDPNKPWWTTRSETASRVIGDGKEKQSKTLGGTLFPVEIWKWGGEKNVLKDLVSVEFEVYGQGTRGNRSITYEFTARDGSHKFKVKGIQSEKVNEKTRVDIIEVKANTTYDVVATVAKGRGARSEVVEQGLLENAGRKAKENRKFQEEQRSATIFGDIVASLNDNDDIQITAKRGKFKASNRRLVEVKVSDEVKQKFKDQPNRFKRATFDLTYRVNVPSNPLRKIKPSFMNNYAVSPQMESDQPGTDKAGKPYSIFYKEYFPHDGTYTFRGAADNISEVIFDGESIMDISNTFNQTPVKKKIEVKEGLHEIRIDLLNSPQKVKPKPITKDLSITYYGLNKGSTKTVRGEKSYAIRTEGANKQAGRRVRNKGREVQFDDDANNGFDENASLKIESTSPGVSAKFNDDGTQMIVNGKGNVSLKFKWDDKKNISGLSVGTLKVGNGKKVSWTVKQKGTKGSASKTIFVGEDDSKEVLGTGGFTVSDGDKFIKMRDGAGDDINSTFSIAESTNNARFSSDGKRLITDGPGVVQLKLDWDDDPSKFGVAVEKISVGGVTLTQSGNKGSTTKTLTIQADGFTVGEGNVPVTSLKSFNQFKSIGTVFNTLDYIKKATRPLYKVKPDVGKSGDFFSRSGVTPFNPVELDPEIPAVPPTPKPAPFVKPKASFIQRGNDLFLKVIGTGRAKIGFRLRTRDKDYISGVFAKEVKISADGPDVRLKRDVKQIYNASGKSRFQGRPEYTERIKEKEKINGEGIFTAGKEYKITTIGGSSDSGFKTVDNTVIFDDDVSGGFDTNGNLSIRFIQPLDKPKPSKTPNLAKPVRSADDYAGTHEIVWNNVSFPASGTYSVDVQVDDNVRLEISNNKFTAQTLDVIGFKSPGVSNGKQTFALEVKKGTYTIRAFLQQIPGKSIYAGNPMGLAVNIKAANVTEMEEVTLLQSWNQNPFGAALTIHAPPPPIPQEPIKEPDGPCPPNPIWTTRHPDFSEQWHPVSHRFASGKRSWSKFMNRYAMSPVLPIGTKGSGYSGSSWDNTWIANIPYTGFYNFKGTVDNFATVTISQDPENSEVLTATTHEVKKIDGFRTEKKDLTSNKVFLEKGKAKIDINVRNGERIKYKQVTKKVFNTADWVTKPSDLSNRINVNFDVFGQGSKQNMALKFIFREKGGTDTFTINNVDVSDTTKTVTRRVKRNVEYDVKAIATGKFTSTVTNERTEIDIEYEYADAKAFGLKVLDKGRKIEYDDDADNGFDENAQLKIMSSSPGVNPKFSNNGKKLIVEGPGNVTIKYKWDDNPRTKGSVLKKIKILGETWRQKGKKGDETRTINIGNTNTGSARTITPTITKRYKTTPLYRYLNSTTGDHFTGIDSAAPAGYINEGVFGHVFIGEQPPGTIPIIDDEEGDRSDAGKPLSRYVAYGFPPDAKPPFSINGTVIQTTLIYAKTNQNDVMWTSDPNEGSNLNPPYTLDTTNNPNGYAFYDAASPIDMTVTVAGEPIRDTDTNIVIDSKTTTTNLVAEQGGSRVFGRGKKGSETSKPSTIIFADIVGSVNDNDEMQIRCNKGEFTSSNKRRIKGTSGQGTQTRGTWDLTYKVIEAEQVISEPITSIGEGFGKYDIKDKELSRTGTTGGSNPNTAPVILNPTLATYISGSLGPFLSPFFPFGTKESGDRLQGRTWEMVWENVEFPVSGDYKMEIEGDDIVEVYIGENLSDSFGQEGYKLIGQTATFRGVEVFNFNIAKSGKRDIKIMLQNVKLPGTTFGQGNPTNVACKITCEVPVEVADTRSWLINPVGISAVLLAPPCKRIVGGGGTVTEVNIVEPGNTYPPPPPGGIPSQVILTGIGVGKAGLGFTTGDQVCIIREDGTKDCYSPEIGAFGEITGVPIKPTPITRYPQITSRIPFVPTITTQVRIDTPEVDPETVIQVTDLAGLKQTGYVEGRPYYGEVFFKDGTPFAGRYETAGRLIQVYATLQESIDAEVTTRPSAIQRSGTDVNSNNPRLNIPGTPDNLA